MSRRRRYTPMAQINVVPYIDVMLVLLVIFMVTAPLLTQGVKVDLPKVQAGEVADSAQEPLVITVDAKGAQYLNISESPESPVDDTVLLTRVAAVLREQPDTRVLIKGDSQVEYAAVVRVLALLQNADVPNVGLITEPVGP